MIVMLFIGVSIPFAGLSAFAANPSTQSAQPAGLDPALLPVLGPAPADTAPLRQTATERQVRVIDQSRIQTENGTIIALSGIEIPMGNGGQEDDAAINAKQFLERLFERDTRRDITLYQTQVQNSSLSHGRTNRLGHDLAHVVRKDGNIWVQGAMIAHGIARARPTPSNPELAERMFALEDEAINARRGLWAEDSPHRLFQSDDHMDVPDQFAVVEGVVQKVAIVNNVTYLNFGPDWKTDFTVGIPSSVRQIIARRGMDVFNLQGQKIRVRGWLRRYNGPYIELEHPVLLQNIEKGQDSNAR